MLNGTLGWQIRETLDFSKATFRVFAKFARLIVIRVRKTGFIYGSWIDTVW